MLLALYGYAIVIIFMILIMTKKLSALTSLLLVSVVIGCIAGFGPDLAEYALMGMESVAGTAALLLFAVSYFCIQLGSGMFDPLAARIVRFVKGDPVRVLVVNYRTVAQQSQVLENASATVFPCICLIFAAGCFMGILQGTGMSDAIAYSLVEMVPESMGSHFGLITSLISIPGTFFLSNDAFYFGIVPILAEAAQSFGFTNLQIGLASLTGQAFHLLTPLIASNYLLLNLSGCNMGEWQRQSAKWAIGIYIIYVVTMFGILRMIPL